MVKGIIPQVKKEVNNKIPLMENVAAVQRAMDAKGWNKRRLTMESGASSAAVTRFFQDGMINSENTFKILNALGLNGLDRIPAPARHDKPIPVISWVSAGHFSECGDHWPAGTSGEGDPVTSTKKLNDNVFGLRIVGDSMEPRYMVGDVIVIDPSLHCDNGCRCVVKLNGEVTFKVFNESDSEIRLSSLNEKYPDIIIRKDSKVEFKVIGKVVDMIPKL